LAEREGIPEEDARARLLRRAGAFIERVREVQLHVAARPAVLDALAATGAGGRECVEAVQGRKDVPFLALAVH
jgi:hypothetical protein